MCGGFWCYKMSELLTVFLLFYVYLLISFFQSGKLVMKMFQKIQELIDDQDALVFVLIDEVRFVHIKLLINSNCKVVFFSYFKRKRNWCQYVFLGRKSDCCQKKHNVGEWAIRCYQGGERTAYSAGSDQKVVYSR